MGFNYRKEKEKFQRGWIRLARQYRDAGMCCAQLNAIYEYDYQEFCQERSFYRHLADKLPDYFWEVWPELETEDRYFQDTEEHLDILLDEFCPGLSERATPRDKEIIILRMKGFNQKEIADFLEIQQATVCKHLKKLKKYFERGL